MLETQLSQEVIHQLLTGEQRKLIDSIAAGLFIAEYYADQDELVESIIGHLNTMSLIYEERAHGLVAKERQGEADAAARLRSQPIEEAKKAQEDKQPCSSS